ncbi:junctional adhesion molecule A-like [Leptodactylus fuscus]
MEEAKRLSCALYIVLYMCAAVFGDNPIRAKEGESVEFPCDYPSSFQNPRIEWKFTSSQEASLIYFDGKTTVNYQDRAQPYPRGLRLNGLTRKDSGEYTCEVTDTSSGKPSYAEKKTQLVVLVPPSTPVAHVPKSVTIGSPTTLHCAESDASPRPIINWYKNKVLMPEDPKTSPSFLNSTYTIDPTTGDLTFNPVTQADAGDYYCEASNELGRLTSVPVTMETYEKNVGGIVAAVIIVLLLVGLIAFGVWFAYSRGYIGSDKKVIYSQPSETRSDKNFQQTSSFVV